MRGSLIYRAFCRLDCERVPDEKTLIRLSQALGPEVRKGILERLVQAARQRRVARGRKLRVDTTVVETNLHHPTDSTLLQDGVRVITRPLHKTRRWWASCASAIVSAAQATASSPSCNKDES